MFFFHIFGWPPKRHYFCRVLFQHKRKCNFLFENIIFDIPKILQKHYFGTTWHYLCFFNIPQNTIKTGKTVKTKKKLGPVFNTGLGPVLNTGSPKSWTNFKLYSTYIYIYYVPLFCLSLCRGMSLHIKLGQRHHGANVSCSFYWGGEMYYSVWPPKPLLEASQAGIGPVGAYFLQGIW